jgi:hypothetical protein
VAAHPAALEVTGVLRPFRIKPLANGRFVVELVTSAKPFGPREVPHLDLFALYHLYHHIESSAGSVLHSLRLGFFKEAAAAQAIASYAAGYFPAPRITQISHVEEAGSQAHVFTAGKDVGASGRFAAIELSAPPPVPSVHAAGAPCSAATAAPRPRREQSFWARLFAPRHA